MFDGPIETLANEMNNYFKIMQSIHKKASKLTGKAKEAKLEPILEGIALCKAKLMDLLIRKNQKIEWYDKLPQEHQFYKHLINVKAVDSIVKGVDQKV